VGIPKDQFRSDEDTHASGSGSRRRNNANSEESREEEEEEEEILLPLTPAGSMTSTSPLSVLRRLPGIFGGGGGSAKQ